MLGFHRIWPKLKNTNQHLSSERLRSFAVHLYLGLLREKAASLRLHRHSTKRLSGRNFKWTWNPTISSGWYKQVRSLNCLHNNVMCEVIFCKKTAKPSNVTISTHTKTMLIRLPRFLLLSAFMFAVCFTQWLLKAATRKVAVVVEQLVDYEHQTCFQSEIISKAGEVTGRFGNLKSSFWFCLLAFTFSVRKS